MSDSIKDYQATTADWRSSIRSNERRTRIVIFAFILLYVALGLLIDLYLNSQHYYTTPLPVLFLALISFKLTPYATLITSSIAVISIWITFTFYDRLMLLGTEYFEVTPETARSLEETQLYNTVEEMKIAAGLKYMPRVFIIEVDYMNAFATGYSEKSALVAITRGLLQKLDRSEMQAVMAHELSHIRHMDIKLTLMASVLANLMLIMIDMLFYGVVFGRNRRSDNDRNGGGWLVIVIVILRYTLPLLTVLLMLFLSRTREFMADAGCVELMRDNEPLARALLKIQGDYVTHQDRYNAEYSNTPHEGLRRESYIFDPTTAGINSQSSTSDIFSTHPNIQSRLMAIGFKNKN